MRTGILGGTFNPIHRSHLYLAEEYRRELELDRILLIPTHTPPHKAAADLADARHRLAMCRLAAQDSAFLEVCSYEADRRETSYTWKTLEHLREQYPTDCLFLLMGADMFLTVQEWRRPEKIWSNAVLCAAARQEGELERMERHRLLLEERGARCRVLPMSPKPLSSTAVREKIRSGRSAEADLSPAVWDYIREHRLYGYGGKRMGGQNGLP